MVITSHVMSSNRCSYSQICSRSCWLARWLHYK